MQKCGDEVVGFYDSGLLIRWDITGFYWFVGNIELLLDAGKQIYCCVKSWMKWSTLIIDVEETVG